jgi:cysteinyl-tRNA synthetase
MEDDFNTPEAISVLFDMTREINRLKDKDEVKAAALAASMVKMGEVLGILHSRPEAFLQKGNDSVDSADIEELIARREQARAEKNWQEADAIRDELMSLNVVLEDKGGVTSWRIERE